MLAILSLNKVCDMRKFCLVDNVGDMSATCHHGRHVSVISGRQSNSADTDHQISRVVSQFGVVVCTTYVVLLTDHK